jgi:endonuclease/exonuclease/phosphatase family metal-dependent hydrolase
MMRLLSWNVQWCRGIDGRVDPARIAAEIRRLGGADVLCLQEIAVNYPEMPGSKGEDQVAMLQREFADYAVFFAAGVDLRGSGGRRRQFGNVLLSRLPVGRVRRHALPWPPSPDSYSMPRVAVEAVVNADFGALRVTTTHLEYHLVEHRAAQIGRLRGLHAEACAERLRIEEPGSYETVPPLPQSAIVCGDFNLKPEDPLHALMRHAGFEDAWDALNPAAERQPTFHVHDGEAPYCCDFVFLSEDLLPRLRSIRIDAATQASDHQPVIVELG